MCGRYTVIDDDDIAELTRIIPSFRGHIPPGGHASGEVMPGAVLPILTSMGDLMTACWGFSRAADSRRVFNARSETIGESRMFSPHLKYGRCIAPARDYFEWQTDPDNPKRKIKHRISRRDGGLLLFGALYRPHNGGFEYTIITRPAASEILFIHPRMPLILEAKRAAEWLEHGLASISVTEPPPLVYEEIPRI